MGHNNDGIIILDGANIVYPGLPLWVDEYQVLLLVQIDVVLQFELLHYDVDHLLRVLQLAEVLDVNVHLIYVEWWVDLL